MGGAGAAVVGESVERPDEVHASSRLADGVVEGVVRGNGNGETFRMGQLGCEETARFGIAALDSRAIVCWVHATVKQCDSSP